VALVVLGLPYPYETGGAFSILPMDRQDITAELPGTLEEIFFNGGEAVSMGTVVARLNASEEKKNILTTQAAISEQQAKLDKLLNSPTPEEVQLAKKRLQTARTQAKYSKESAARLEKVYSKGSISLEAYQDAKRKMDVDNMEVLEAKANLEKVEAGPHPQEIEAAKFELQRLQEQLVYSEDQLKRTDLIMPIDGVIATRNLKHKIGTYLSKGDLFAAVENHSQVLVEVEVPESDISEVVIGADVRAKVWTYPDRFFLGKVTGIAPVVEQDSHEKVVMATTIVANPDGVLRSGMTGFAKIDGGTKPVVVAFTRMFVRFFMVEMWSWLP
jgi:putative peptide zinc metalloprotease protein